MSSKAKTRLLQKSELFNLYTSYVVNWDPTKPTETFTTKTSQNDIPIPKPIKPAGHEEANLRLHRELGLHQAHGDLYTRKTSENGMQIPKPVMPVGHEEVNLRVIVFGPWR
ncbi:hypothetical protein G6F43_003484 [Rhizopus delemar]|nr:hypothetical protein G6F43_003484 [Rhizopus delemar]